jgi:hypothetical protein
MKKRVFLSEVRGRLEDDVGFLINVIQRRNRREPHIGFYPAVRMIMPIIDSIAFVYGESPAQILSRVGLKKPELTWNLYRHTLVHNDGFQFGKLGRNRGIQPGIVISTANEERELATTLDQSTWIDVGALYRKLIVWLDQEIGRTSERSSVDVKAGVWVLASKPLGRKIKEELES